MAGDKMEDEDNSGRVVENGIYFYRLEAHTTAETGYFVQMKRMLLLK
jgi:hypothetical protein